VLVVAGLAAARVDCPRIIRSPSSTESERRHWHRQQVSSGRTRTRFIFVDATNDKGVWNLGIEGMSPITLAARMDRRR